MEDDQVDEEVTGKDETDEEVTEEEEDADDEEADEEIVEEEEDVEEEAMEADVEEVDEELVEGEEEEEADEELMQDVDVDDGEYDIHGGEYDEWREGWEEEEEEWTEVAEGSGLQDDIKKRDIISDEDSEDGEEVKMNLTDLELSDKIRDELSSSKVSQKGPKADYSDRLTEEFKMLMGEANLCVAKRDHKTAINICLEIIRNIPDSPAPYETLSVIFEEEGDLYKSLQYGLISAHLWPKDPHKWFGLAEKCSTLKDVENEKVCMGKALRFSYLTRDKGFIEQIISYFVKPSEWNDELGEETAKKLASGYQKLVKISTPDDRQELLGKINNFELRCRDDLKNLDSWAKAYSSFVAAHKDLICLEKVCRVLKTWLACKSYYRIAPFLVQSGLATSTATTRADPSKSLQEQVDETVDSLVEGNISAVTTLGHVIKYTLTAEYPPLVRAALVTALLYTGHHTDNIQELSAPLLELDPLLVSEELVYVADAHYHANDFPSAQSFYEAATRGTKSDDPHSLLHMGLCLEEKGEWKASVVCYEKVLAVDPSNTPAKLRLFSLQQEYMAEHEGVFSVNIHEDATDIEDLSTRPDVVKLSYHRCNELIAAGDVQGALDEGHNIFKTALFESIEVFISKWKNNARGVGNAESIRGSHVSGLALGTLQRMTKQKLGRNEGLCEAYRDMLPREQWYEWYIGLVSCCLADGRNIQAFHLCLGVLSSRLIDIESVIKDVQIHSLYLAGVLDFPEYISETIGQVMYLNPDTPGIWNIFYSIRARLPTARLLKLGVRWVHKHKGAFNGLFFAMQNAYCSRHYNAAMAFFRQLLGQKPRDSKIYFHLSLFYLHFACNKSTEFAARRHEHVVQAVACILMYQQLRGPCQETYYNVGRCYHHLGLSQLALQYYRKVLATPPLPPDEVTTAIERINRKHKPSEVAKPDVKPVRKQPGGTPKKGGVKEIGVKEREGGMRELEEDEEIERRVELEDVDLSHETVHNMCQIYSACGSEHLARQLLYKYAVI